MRSLAYPLALALVVVVPVLVVAAAHGVGRWSRWLVRAGGALGVAGLVLTAVATVNLLVPRSCGHGSAAERNRPLISVVVGDGDCFRSAMGQVQIAVLVALAASLAVLTRSARGDVDRVPAARRR